MNHPAMTETPCLRCGDVVEGMFSPADEDGHAIGGGYHDACAPSAYWWRPRPLGPWTEVSGTIEP